MQRVLFLRDWDVSRSETERLLAQAECPYLPAWMADDAPPAEDVEVLATKEHHVASATLAPWPNLRMVSLGFTGYDHVALDDARSRRIAVYYVPGYATASVAELIVGLTLCVLRRLPQADRHVQAGEWDERVVPGTELAGKSVGIVGTGTIGLQAARLFAAFGCRLLGWARPSGQRDDFVALGGAYVSRAELFQRADVVVLCLALNDETRAFVGQPELGAMRPGAVLINTARSELVEPDALLAALLERRIFAGLDVYSQEPARGVRRDAPFAVPLQGLDNVVLTPHIGFKTTEALARLAQETIGNIGRFLRGDRTNRLV